jgi:hypothetical protein
VILVRSRARETPRSSRQISALFNFSQERTSADPRSRPISAFHGVCAKGLPRTAPSCHRMTMAQAEPGRLRVQCHSSNARIIDSSQLNIARTKSVWPSDQGSSWRPLSSDGRQSYGTRTPKFLFGNDQTRFRAKLEYRRYLGFSSNDFRRELSGCAAIARSYALKRETVPAFCTVIRCLPSTLRSSGQSTKRCSGNALLLQTHCGFRSTGSETVRSHTAEARSPVETFGIIERGDFAETLDPCSMESGQGSVKRFRGDAGSVVPSLCYLSVVSLSPNREPY